jgi:hypothetical protein
MPNHVINELIFRDVDCSAQERVTEVACNPNGVDFGVLVPMPLNIWRGCVGSIHKVFKGNSLDWACANWGTKWNAYQSEVPEKTADTLTLRFQTAWSPPYPWLAALFNSTKLSFEHNWLDEGREDGFAGKFIWKDDGIGPEWSEAIADEPLHRHLHKLLLGVEQFPDEEQPA